MMKGLKGDETLRNCPQLKETIKKWQLKTCDCGLDSHGIKNIAVNMGEIVMASLNYVCVKVVLIS